LELQKVMWTTNAGLTDRHAFDSRPDSWPRLRRGINFWVKDHKQIYLIGNPMIWWSSTLAVGLYALVRGFLILRQKRGYRDFDNTKVVKYDTLCGFLFIGWALHYLPFFLMARQLFLHHYFPALYFAILLYCAVFDLVTSSLRPKVRLQIAAVLVVLAVWNFQHFAPLAYGTEWTRGKCESSRWLKTWDFSCVDFHDEYSQYRTSTITPVKSSVTTVGGEPDGRGAHVVNEQVAQANINNPNHNLNHPHHQDSAEQQKQKGQPPAQHNNTSNKRITRTRPLIPGNLNLGGTFSQKAGMKVLRVIQSTSNPITSMARRERKRSARSIFLLLLLNPATIPRRGTRRIRTLLTARRKIRRRRKLIKLQLWRLRQRLRAKLLLLLLKPRQRRTWKRRVEQCIVDRRGLWTRLVRRRRKLLRSCLGMMSE